MPMDTKNLSALSEYLSDVGLVWNESSLDYDRPDDLPAEKLVGIPTPYLIETLKGLGDAVHELKQTELMQSNDFETVMSYKNKVREILDAYPTYSDMTQDEIVRAVWVPKNRMYEPLFDSVTTRDTLNRRLQRRYATLRDRVEGLFERMRDVSEPVEAYEKDWVISACCVLMNEHNNYGNLRPMFKGIEIAQRYVKLSKMEKVIDFEGNEIASQDALVFTAQSNYEGEYVRFDECVVIEDCHTHDGKVKVVVTQHEADDHWRRTVDRENVWRPDCEDDLVYLECGRHADEWCWRDDSIWCEDNGAYYHLDDEGEYVFWNERTDEYQCEPPSEGRCHDYHSGFRRNRLSDNTVWTIGFEVEKEDDYPVDAHDLYDVDETGWCREEDGSLNDDGFELVSPVYDLFQNRMDNDIAESRILRDHIDAEYSSNCGGHINFGKRGITGDELFDQIQAFVPLFITIWRHRLGNSYSQMKRKPDDYKRAGKYSAIHVKGSYLEVRVPPAVKSVTNLLWRRDLMRIVASNCGAKPLQVITMMLSSKSALGQHLRKVYTSEEQIHKIVSIYAQFADDMYSSFNFTSDGAGVFIKSAVRRLKNRKVKGTQIVSYTSEATDRLRNTFGRNYVTDAQSSLEYIDELLND